MLPLIRPSTFNLFPAVVSAMTTRLGGASVEPFGMNTSYDVADSKADVTENRWRLCDALDIWLSKLTIQKQVHGDNVTIVEKPGIIENNDALITRQKSIYLGISVADCQPILLYDRRVEVVAAVHAGWRGAAKHIAKKTLDVMHEKFDSRPEDIFAFVGPCASQCCYEVDDKVAAQFEWGLSKTKSKNKLVRDLKGGVLVPKSSKVKEEKKFMLDLKGATMLDLLEFGLPRTHIEISPMCTICNAEYFHSYRRDGARSGRMLAVIGMRG